MSTIAAVPLLTGCGTDRSGDPGSAPTTDAPASVESTERRSGPGSGGSDLVLVDVRVAETERSDRIVLEFSGTGTPGWVVDYVDEAVLEGSGDTVALGGSAILDIHASGTTWPARDYYRGPSRFTPQNDGEVIDVYVGGTFEGYTQVLAGIEGRPAPFRVFARTAPPRLVVDVG